MMSLEKRFDHYCTLLRAKDVRAASTFYDLNANDPAFIAVAKVHASIYMGAVDGAVRDNRSRRTAHSLSPRNARNGTSHDAFFSFGRSPAGVPPYGC